MLGLDDRSQFDMIAALPGGMAGVRRFVRELQLSGVKVLWPVLNWDTGTRGQGVKTDFAKSFAALLAETGADGLNGDSQVNMAEDYWLESVHAQRPAALQAENGPNATNPTALNWQTMDIGYWGGSTGHYTGGGGGSWPFAPA
eukprot:COSAG04_NODE_126_length_24619_cov_8.688132_7_plen_143_part_00